MQHGDWRLQPVGRPDEMHLVHAVFCLVAMVVVFFLARRLLADTTRRR